MAGKLTIFIEQGEQSWTEAHIDSAIADPTTADAGANELARRRGNLLGAGAQVFAVRCSIVGDPGNADDVDIGVGYAGGRAAVGTANAPVEGELANDCLMLSAVGKIGGKTYRKKVYLGGIPDGIVKTRFGAPVYSPDPRFATDLKVYTDYLTANLKFPVKVETLTQVVDSLGMQQAAPGLLTVVAPNLDNVLFAAGNKVHLRGFRVHPTTRKRLAGVWKIQSRTGPVAGLYTLALLGTAGMDPTAYIDGGTVSAISLGFCPYTTWGEPQGGTRRRGFAGSRPVGRAKTKG